MIKLDLAFGDLGNRNRYPNPNPSSLQARSAALDPSYRAWMGMGMAGVYCMDVRVPVRIDSSLVSFIYWWE